MPEQVRLPEDELEALAELSDTIHFQVLKRVARRYTENMKNQAFTLNSSDPNLAIKHSRLVEQAVGMNLLVRIIEQARTQLNREEGNGK